MNVIKEHNKFADILCSMVEVLNDRNLHCYDFSGHLGMSSKYPNLTYSRVILRTWFFQNAYKYIYHLISEEEFLKVRKEYQNKDKDFWENHIFDCYHQSKCLPAPK